MTGSVVEILDLRGLQPPRPMMEILNRITAPAPHALEVLLPHVPIFLLPELDERGWSYAVLSDEPGCCRFRLDPPEKV